MLEVCKFFYLLFFYLFYFSVLRFGKGWDLIELWVMFGDGEWTKDGLGWRLRITVTIENQKPIDTSYVCCFRCWR